MANKMTKREMFQAIKAVEGVASNEAMVEFINHEIDLLDRKGSNKKATKTQIENEATKQIILDTLAGQNPMTVTELQKANETLGALSNQKVSALLRQLYLAKVVDKIVDKKVSRFAVA